MNNLIIKCTYTLVILLVIAVSSQVFTAKINDSYSLKVFENNSSSIKNQIINQHNGNGLESQSQQQTSQMEQAPALITSKPIPAAAEEVTTPASTPPTIADDNEQKDADLVNKESSPGVQVKEAAIVPASTPPDTGVYEQQVIELVNEERTSAGLPALEVNTNLAGVAEKKVEDLRDKGYFAHRSPTYGSPFDMMKQFGIKYTTAGENIAKGQKTPSEVMDDWMNSEGHRANILNSNFTEIGVSYVVDNNGVTYWCQMFVRQ